MPAVSTSCPGRLSPGSEGPRCRPAVLGDSRLGPWSRGVDQLSQGTRARVPVPAVSNSCPGRLRPVSLDPRSRPAAPGDSGPCLRSQGSTRYPGRPGAGFQCPRVRPAVWGASGPCPWARGVDQLPRETVVPGARPDVPGEQGPGSSACGVDQLSRVTRARIRGPAGSTRCLGRLELGSEGPPDRPALPADSGA